MTTLPLDLDTGNSISRFDVVPLDILEREQSRRRKLQRRLNIEREKNRLLRDQLKWVERNADIHWRSTWRQSVYERENRRDRQTAMRQTVKTLHERLSTTCNNSNSSVTK